MLKGLVFIIAAVVGFLVAFSFTASDEIGAEVARQLDEDFVEQCVAQNRWPANLAGREHEVCKCMKGKFDARGIALTDAFGERNGEMREISTACASRYASAY